VVLAAVLVISNNLSNGLAVAICFVFCCPVSPVSSHALALAHGALGVWEPLGTSELETGIQIWNANARSAFSLFNIQQFQHPTLPTSRTSSEPEPWQLATGHSNHQ
jgi:hypothetical protein